MYLRPHSRILVPSPSSFISPLSPMAKDITDAEFEKEVIKSDVPVLVDFWAPWCGPCKSMIPIVDELSTEFDGKIQVVKINVDENSETPSKFSVMSIPTFVIFKDGDAVNTLVGAQSKDDLKSAIETVFS
jgi:thioredoxin 1